jgi:DnaD/phage-associated family protein
MASRRMISADVWRDDFVTGLDFLGRLLWIGLITTCADDQGRLQNKPLLIRSDIFPLDDVSETKISAYIQNFANAGRVLLYEVGDKSIIQILNWWKHQAPSWAAASKYPAPAGWVDRIKIHQGSKVLTSGFDQPGGFARDNGSPIPIPTHLPKDLPKSIYTEGGKGIEESSLRVDEVREREEESPLLPPRPEIFSIYESEIGPITGLIADKLLAAINEFPETWIVEALQEASTHNARSWAYAEAILKSRKAGKGKLKSSHYSQGTITPPLTPEQEKRGQKPNLNPAQLAEWQRAKAEKQRLLGQGDSHDAN